MDREREQRVVELLTDNIRTELAAANAMNALNLDDAVLDRLASAVAANVLYAFAVDWAPDWVKPGEFHAWESSDEWYGRCPVCLADSPPAQARETAIGWAADHASGHRTQS